MVVTTTPSKLERAYGAFVRYRRVIRSAEREPELLAAICETAVAELGFRLAWIGLIQPPDPVVHPVAQAGYEDGYLSAIRITWSSDELGEGPTGRAIRTCRPAVARDIAADPRFAPWRADALRRGYASSAALPLLDGNLCLGALNLYAAEPDAFDDDELALLEEVALDLAIGIRRLRMAELLDSMNLRLNQVMTMEAAGLAGAALAHDINNLLLIIRGSVELAQRERDPDERGRLLDDALTAVDSTAALSRRLLSLSRHTARPSGWIAVDQVVRSSVTLLRRIARSSQLQVQLDAVSTLVQLPALELERVLINLVINAEQATARGGQLSIATRVCELSERRHTSSGALEPGTYLLLSVEDDGEGIAPEVLPKIFEPLFTTKESEGTGLGMSAVLDITRGGGGAVDVESELGVGTRVTVFLPARRAERVGLNPQPVPDDAPTSAARGLA